MLKFTKKNKQFVDNYLECVANDLAYDLEP